MSQGSISSLTGDQTLISWSIVGWHKPLLDFVARPSASTVKVLTTEESDPPSSGAFSASDSQTQPVRSRQWKSLANAHTQLSNQDPESRMRREQPILLCTPDHFTTQSSSEPKLMGWLSLLAL
jgi:hypothetical protein